MPALFQAEVALLLLPHPFGLMFRNLLRLIHQQQQQPQHLLISKKQIIDEETLIK
jgi:hypothetical protein